MKFVFIRAEKANHALATLCRVVGVQRSSFYAWCNRPESQRSVDDSRLAAEIEAVFHEHKSRYGSVRITRELRAKGVRVGRHRVRRLMRLTSLQARRRRAWIRTTDSRHAHPKAPNLLKRRFQIDQPNRVWAADITYLPTRCGWIYLAVVLDLFSRAVVGWSMSPPHRREAGGRCARRSTDAKDPTAGCHHALGPGRAVRGRRPPAASQSTRDELQHEPQGRLLG
jgi:putative transposase